MSEVVTSLADPTANVIFGAVIDDQYEGEVHVTIIATGFSATFEDNILSGKVVSPPQSKMSQDFRRCRRPHRVQSGAPGLYTALCVHAFVGQAPHPAH